jgi:predicted permease
VFVAVFGDHTNDEGITLHDLEQSYKEPSFIVYIVVLTLWLLLVSYWIMSRSTSELLKRFAFGVAGGSVTGAQNFIKDGLTVLKADEGLPWYFPILGLLAVGTAFGGLLFLTACMKRYDATYSSSMFVGSYVASASLMSALHYHTFANLESWINYVFYPMGLLILMVGVWILIKETREDNEEATSNVSALKSVHSLEMICLASH